MRAQPEYHETNAGRTMSHAMLVIAFTFLLAGTAHSQQVVNLWPGVAPGSETLDSKGTQG